MFGVTKLAPGKDDSFGTEWGKVLKVYSEKGDSEICLKGISGVLTKADIEQGTEFYVPGGMEKEKAREEAVKYMIER